jgi:imidazolonepropionase-like amidohydrolase
MVQADLIVENAAQVVTCDPTRGAGGRVGLVERGAVAAEVGSLRPGKFCDLVLCDVTDWQQVPYIFGVNHAGHVIKRGRAAWGT